MTTLTVITISFLYCNIMSIFLTVSHLAKVQKTENIDISPSHHFYIERPRNKRTCTFWVFEYYYISMCVSVSVSVSVCLCLMSLRKRGRYNEIVYRCVCVCVWPQLCTFNEREWNMCQWVWKIERGRESKWVWDFVCVSNVCVNEYVWVPVCAFVDVCICMRVRMCLSVSVCRYVG